MAGANDLVQSQLSAQAETFIPGGSQDGGEGSSPPQPAVSGSAEGGAAAPMAGRGGGAVVRVPARGQDAYDIAAQLASQQGPPSERRKGYYSEEHKWWVPYYVGSLKSFSQHTGYGFIECQETFAIYGRDVYIHKNLVPTPWRINSQVEFAVTQNSRGQPQAADVMWLTQPDKAGAQPMNLLQPGTTRQLRRIAAVKSFSTPQGYGFLTSEEIQEEFGRDVYLDRRWLPQDGDWAVELAVEFEVSLSKRGQPQAINVVWDPVPSLHQGEPVGEMGQMTAKSIRELNALLSHLHREELNEAVLMALELNRTSQFIDHVRFVLDRCRPAEENCARLTAVDVRGSLLEYLSGTLRGMTERGSIPVLPQYVSWCKALLQSLSLGSGEDEEKKARLRDIVARNLQEQEQEMGTLGGEAAVLAPLASLKECLRNTAVAA